MKISFNSPDALMDDAFHGHIVDGVVRFRSDAFWEQEDRVTCKIDCWLTCLVENKDGNVFLYEWADRIEPEQCEEIRPVLETVCKDRGVELRPGRIEVY